MDHILNRKPTSRLTLKDKLTVAQLSSEGMSQREIVRKHGISKSQASRILKSKSKLVEIQEKRIFNFRSKGRANKSRYPAVDEAPFNWFKSKLHPGRKCKPLRPLCLSRSILQWSWNNRKLKFLVWRIFKHPMDGSVGAVGVLISVKVYVYMEKNSWK